MGKQKTITVLFMVLGMTAGILSGCGNSKPEAAVTEQTEEVNENDDVFPESGTDDGNEGSETNDGADMKDLSDYFGATIDQAAADLPELQYDDSYRNSEGTTEISGPTDTMEKMSDGLALAGPFFTVDRQGTIVGVNYGGKSFSVCGITAGMPMSEAAEIAKSHGLSFSRAEIAHGTAKFVAIYDNGEMQLCISSDADGDFGKTEESDVTGNVDSVLLTSPDLSGSGEGASDIYKGYLDIVSEADPKKWDGFALIDLDGDGVKELFATCINGERVDESMQPYMIAGHNDKEPIINDELSDGVAGAGGYRGTLYYLEGKGILHESMNPAPFGVPADTIYSLKDGRIEITDNGEFVVDSYDDNENEDWDPLQHGSYTWNGKEVTEDEYKEKLKEATNDTEGLPMCEIDWKNKDAITSELESLF